MPQTHVEDNHLIILCLDRQTALIELECNHVYWADAVARSGCEYGYMSWPDASRPILFVGEEADQPEQYRKPIPQPKFKLWHRVRVDDEGEIIEGVVTGMAYTTEARASFFNQSPGWIYAIDQDFGVPDTPELEERDDLSVHYAEEQLTLIGRAEPVEAPVWFDHLAPAKAMAA